MGDISDLQIALDWSIEGAETSTGIWELLEFADELCEQFTISGNMADLNTAVTLSGKGLQNYLREVRVTYAAVINNLAN